MNQNSLIAIDLAKSVFQDCVLVNNKVITNKTIRRSQFFAFIAQQKPQKIFMEACYSSHYWAREFIALKH